MHPNYIACSCWYFLIADRICQQKSVCDFLFSVEIEFPPAGLPTFEVFPGSADRDRVCWDVEASCDWDIEFLDHTTADFAFYAAGAFDNTWGDWGAVFTAVDLQDSFGMVSYDIARSYGVWESLFIEVDLDGDRQLHRSELDAFREQNMTGPNAMSTRSRPGIEEGSPQQPSLAADYQCMPLTTCDPEEQYQVTAKALHLDRTCSNVTVCDSDEFESSPPSSTSDRRCSPVTQCRLDQQQLQAATSTTDRICVTAPTSAPTSSPSVQLCDPCEGAADVYDGETCTFFQDNSMCAQHAANCARTCCTLNPMPCSDTTATTPSPTTAPTSMPTSTARLPPPEPHHDTVVTVRRRASTRLHMPACVRAHARVCVLRVIVWEGQSSMQACHNLSKATVVGALHLEGLHAGRHIILYL